MNVSPAPTRSLSGARVLLVGASGGIGRPLAAALVGRGAHLALAGRDRSRLARAAIPILPRGGFILNVSGVIAELPTAGLVAYSAAKAGISAGFRALAREVRPRSVSVIDARPPHTEVLLQA